MSLIDVEAALDRAHLVWTTDTSHVDAEEAFHDRTLLADEVTKLRDAIGGYQNRVTELQDDIEQLQRESISINRDMLALEQRVQTVLTGAHWTEVEPGCYINPDLVHWVRDLGNGHCQVLLGTTGVTVHRLARDVVSQLRGADQ